MRSRGAGLRQDETAERRAGPPAALQPPVTDRPARRAGPYHVGRISTAADRKRGARPTPHHCNGAPRPAPTPWLAAFVPGRLSAHSPGPSVLAVVLQAPSFPRLPAPENLAPRKPSNQRGFDAAGDDVPR